MTDSDLSRLLAQRSTERQLAVLDQIIRSGRTPEGMIRATFIVDSKGVVTR